MEESSSEVNFPVPKRYSEMAPAQMVSSRLNLSCHPEQRHKVFLFCSSSHLHKASRFNKEPTTTVGASLAMDSAFVPLVVERTTSFHEDFVSQRSSFYVLLPQSSGR